MNNTRTNDFHKNVSQCLKTKVTLISFEVKYDSLKIYWYDYIWLFTSTFKSWITQGQMISIRM